MTAGSEPDLYRWRAVIALDEAELPEANPRPLAAWARGRMAGWPSGDDDAPRPYEHVGVIVAATGAVLAETRQHERDNRLYEVVLDARSVSLSVGMNELRRRTGAPVAYVRGWQVCKAAVPLHLRGPRS